MKQLIIGLISAAVIGTSAATPCCALASGEENLLPEPPDVTQTQPIPYEQHYSIDIHFDRREITIPASGIDREIRHHHERYNQEEARRPFDDKTPHTESDREIPDRAVKRA